MHSMNGLLKSFFAHSIVAGSSSDDEGRREKMIAKTNKDGLDCDGFQMPLHYPRYARSDYETMEEWKVDMLLREYGVIDFKGGLDEKRRFAMGAFLWPDQF